MTEEVQNVFVLEVPEAVTATDVAFQTWHNFSNQVGDVVVPMFATTETGFEVTVTIKPIRVPEE